MINYNSADVVTLAAALTITFGFAVIILIDWLRQRAEEKNIKRGRKK